MSSLTRIPTIIPKIVELEEDFCYYNILVVGSKGSGKTTFINKLYKNEIPPTMVKMKDSDGNVIESNDPLEFPINVNNHNGKMLIYEFDSIPPQKYFRGVNAVLYMYDMYDPNSISHLKTYMTSFFEKYEEYKKFRKDDIPDPVIMIAANKSDIPYKGVEEDNLRMENVNHGKLIAKEYKAEFTITSGYENVERPFHFICYTIDKEKEKVKEKEKEENAPKRGCTIV